MEWCGGILVLVALCVPAIIMVRRSPRQEVVVTPESFHIESKRRTVTFGTSKIDEIRVSSPDYEYDTYGACVEIRSGDVCESVTPESMQACKLVVDRLRYVVNQVLQLVSYRSHFVARRSSG